MSTPSPEASGARPDQYGRLRRSVLAAAQNLSKAEVLDLADALHEELRLRRGDDHAVGRDVPSPQAAPYQDGERIWL